MKITKIVWFNIIALIAMVNAYLLYFGEGMMAFSISKAYFGTIWQGALLIFILWLIGLLCTLAYLVSRAITKKNLLRISLLVLVIMLISSIVGRILEVIAGTFCVFCWVQTVLYIVLIVLCTLMLKDLKKLIDELFLKR